MLAVPRLLLIGAALALAGCVATRPAAPPPADALPPPPPPGAGPQSLLGVEWQITEYAGTPVASDARANLRFADGRVSGTAGCNSFSGTYETGADFTIRFGELTSTMMACADPLMQQERAVLDLLAAVTSYTFDASGGLILATPDNRMLRAQRG
ncbi:MAG: META domain-containing protein [Sphingomonadaceae bacterium]